MPYVEVFLLAVSKDRIEDYKKVERSSVPILKEFGATTVVECIGDDVPYGELTSFPRAVQAKDDEIVILSWIVYPSKEVRDAANARMMSDERFAEIMKDAPIDGKRLISGGFVPFIGL